MAFFTVRIFSASSSGISISKASSNAITSSTVSSESAPRSSTKEALAVTSASSTPNCSTMICFTRSSTDAIDEQSPFNSRQGARSCHGRRAGPAAWRELQLLLGFGVLVDVGDRVLHGADLLRVFVGDLD